MTYNHKDNKYICANNVILKYRRLKNVETQFLLISLAHNMINYISKRDTGRLKKHLF